MSNHQQQQPQQQQPHPQQVNPYQQQQQQQPQVVFLPLFPNMNPEDLIRFANLLLPQLLNGNNNNNNGMNNSNAGMNVAQQSTANIAPNNNEVAAANLVAALASVAANPLANLATLFPNQQQQQIEHQQPQVHQQQVQQVHQQHHQHQQQVQAPAHVHTEPTAVCVPHVPVQIQAKHTHHRQQQHRQVPRGITGATAPASANVAPPLDIQPRPEAPPSNSIVAVQVKKKAAVSNGSSPINVPAEDNSKTSAIDQKPSLSPSSSTSSLSSNSPAEAEGGDSSKNSDDNTTEEEDEENRSPSPTFSSSSSEGSSSLESLEMDIAYLREKQLLLERFSQEMQQDDLYDASNARMAIRQQEQERQDQDTLLSNSTVGSISDDEDESAEDLEGVSIWIRAKKVLRSLSRHRGVMYHPMSAHHQPSSSLDGKSKKKAAQTNKDKKKKAVAASKKRRVRFHDDDGDNQSTATSSSSEQDDVLPGRRTKYRKLIDRSVVRLMTAKDFSAEGGMLIRPHPQHLQASPQQAFATVPGTGFDDHSMKCLHSILTDVSSIPFHTSG